MSTIDSPTPPTDKAVDNPALQAKLSADTEVTPGSKLTTAPTAGDTSVPSLPSLTIDGADPSNTHMPSGAMAVVKDLGQGALNEITQHPGQVAESFVIGGLIGGAAVALGPEAAIGATVLGGAYAAYQLYEHAGSWISAAKTVDDPKDSTPAQVAQANTELQNVGARAVVVGAGMAGALVGGSLVGSVVGSIVDAPVAAANPLDTPAGLTGGDVPPPPAPAAIPAVITPIDSPPPPAPAAITPSDAPPTPAAAAATPPASDAPAQPAPAAANPPGGDAPAQQAAPEATPEQQALARSIQANQALFNNAGPDNPVTPMVKQDYTVRFQRVSEPTPIQSLENLKTGTTEIAQPGQWIATRLNPDGTPNIENGITNSWPVTEKTILKSYQARPEDLQSGFLDAATRTDAPPVQMIQLKAPLTIKTSWGGDTSGESGDWLANYDYENNQPGVDFNIITATSYNQTYEPLATT